MICLSVSRSPHASARPSSVASISTRRACATSLKHSSPCPPRPTASPPPTSPLGCAVSANKALFRTAPATLPTISKNSAANRSFSGSPALAGTTHSRPAFAQWPPSWCFATKPSNPCSLPLNHSVQPVARPTRDPSTPTTVPYRLPCTASFTSSALPLEYRQFFCRASPLSAYGRVAQIAFYDLGMAPLSWGSEPVSVTSSPSSAARNGLSRRVRPSEQSLDQRSHLCNPVSAHRFSRTTADPAPRRQPQKALSFLGGPPANSGT